jgi:hypothetical protein
MTTWTDILSDLRVDMGDNPTNPKLGADQAFLYGKMAIQDYSWWNPRVLSAGLDLDSQGAAALPTGFMSLIEVRDDLYDEVVLPLTTMSNPPGYTLARSQKRWWIEGNTLKFNTWSDDPDTVTILYRGCHALPLSASDETTVMTFPDADEEAILLYIRAKYAGSKRSKTSSADRYKRKVEAGNTRQDNPLAPEEQNLMDEYLAFMSLRYGSVGSIRLVRQRR